MALWALSWKQPMLVYLASYQTFIALANERDGLEFALINILIKKQTRWIAGQFKLAPVCCSSCSRLKYWIKPVYTVTRNTNFALLPRSGVQRDYSEGKKDIFCANNLELPISLKRFLLGPGLRRFFSSFFSADLATCAVQSSHVTSRGITFTCVLFCGLKSW